MSERAGGGSKTWVIAATLVALGTSLPELVTCVAAVRRKHGELAIGNVIGADILKMYMANPLEELFKGLIRIFADTIEMPDIEVQADNR